MRFPAISLALTLLGSGPSPCEATHLEAGNDAYRVSITSSGLRRTGFYTAWTGPAHPVSALIGVPAEVLPVLRDCLTCGGEGLAAAFVIRSRVSGFDYTLGENQPGGMFSIPEPGYTCVCANDLTTYWNSPFTS